MYTIILSMKYFLRKSGITLGSHSSGIFGSTYTKKIYAEFHPNFIYINLWRELIQIVRRREKEKESEIGDRIGSILLLLKWAYAYVLIRKNFCICWRKKNGNIYNNKQIRNVMRHCKNFMTLNGSTFSQWHKTKDGNDK